MSFKTTVTLNTGLVFPAIGLGTWLSKPQEVEKAVEHALRVGYRHLDLAKIYQNQDEVARGIKASGVPRSDIFITSKLWNTWHRADQVALGLEDTLKELQTDYLDLYLIHWPIAFVPGTGANGTNELFPLHPSKEGEVYLDFQTSLVDTWREMIKLKDSGKVKAIGVSNFTIPMIDGLIAATGVTPSIERHPLLPQPELIKYSAEKNIHITAYSPLGNNLKGELKIVEYSEVLEIAKKKGADPAQVLIAWGKRGGHSVIPKSVTPSRIDSNFQEVELTEEEYAAISKIGENKVHRFNIPFDYTPKWDVGLFGEETEKAANNSVKIQ